MSVAIATTHFGIVPLTLTNWNSGTDTATFQLYIPWEGKRHLLGQRIE